MQQDEKGTREAISNNVFGAIHTAFAQYQEPDRENLKKKLIEAQEIFEASGFTTKVVENLTFLLQKIEPIKYYFLHSTIAFYLYQFPVYLGLAGRESR